MTIMVDDPMQTGGRFDLYCHMWSNTSVDELMTFALSIGLRKEWFQDRPGFPHFDVSFRMRCKALESGAKYMPLKAYLEQVKKELPAGS